MLLIDDDPFFRLLVREAVLRHCEVIECGTVREAVDCLASRTVAGVVSDVHLEDGDAREILAWIEAHRPTLRESLVFMSGEPGSEAAQSLALAGLPVRAKGSFETLRAGLLAALARGYCTRSAAG